MRLLLSSCLLGLSAHAAPAPGPIDLLQVVAPSLSVEPISTKSHPPSGPQVKQIFFRYDPSRGSLDELFSFGEVPELQQVVPLYNSVGFPDALYGLTTGGALVRTRNFYSGGKTTVQVFYERFPDPALSAEGVFLWSRNEVVVAASDESLHLASPTFAGFQPLAPAQWLSRLTGFPPANERILKIERIGPSSIVVLTKSGLRKVSWSQLGGPTTVFHLEARMDWRSVQSPRKSHTMARLVDFMSDGDRGAWIVSDNGACAYTAYVSFLAPHAIVGAIMTSREVALLDVDANGDLHLASNGDYEKLSYTKAPVREDPNAFTEATFAKLNSRFVPFRGLSLSSKLLQAPRTWRGAGRSIYTFAPRTAALSLGAPGGAKATVAATLTPGESKASSTSPLARDLLTKIKDLQNAGKLSHLPRDLAQWSPANFCELFDELPDLKTLLGNFTTVELQEKLGLYKGARLQFSASTGEFRQTRFAWNTLWRLLDRCDTTLKP